MIVYVTAAFGARYHRFAAGLSASFRRFMPDATLHLYSDHPETGYHRFDGLRVWPADFEGLYAPYGPYYSPPAGEVGHHSRPNVFKLTVLCEMRERHPDATLCWLDADSLVLDDLDRLLVPGKLNVVAHRHHRDAVRAGPGLKIPPEEWVFGALYAVPPGSFLDDYAAAMERRKAWPDGAYISGSGDQLCLNLVVQDWLRERAAAVHFLDRDETRWWSFANFTGDGAVPRHPGIPWRGYHAIKLDGDGGLWHMGRRFAAFLHNARKVEQFAADDFACFRPEVAEVVRGFYA